MSCCLLVEFIMFVIGLVGVVKGKVSLTRTRIAIGAPARGAAAVMLIPLPVGIIAEAFMGLALFGTISQKNEDPKLAAIGSGAYLIEIAVTLVCFLVAIVICAVTAKPLSARKAAATAIDEKDLRYFDEEEQRRKRDHSEPDENIQK
jgi:hypothetical protein